MFNPTVSMIRSFAEHLQSGYHQSFGSQKSNYGKLIGQIATSVLQTIAHTDALYHDVEHTILVTLAGQEILQGKQRLEGSVSPEDWLHLIVALLCHDIGYIKGICLLDQVNQRHYSAGIGETMIAIAPGATDASLAAYHVDRGKRYVQETLGRYPLIQVEVIQQAIEFTRFPVPTEDADPTRSPYPRLARAADLIGQLSDPHYLKKIPALFYELQESGMNKTLGYHHPGEMQLDYPRFYRSIVYPLIHASLRYLEATPAGNQTLGRLQANLTATEQQQQEVKSDGFPKPTFIQDAYHFFLNEESDQEIEEPWMVVSSRMDG